MKAGLADNDTIVAQATPQGRGGIGVIRVSGPLVPDLAVGILGRLPKPRYACFSQFNDALGEPIDEGLALYFPGPGSFTGEHVLELQGHGGPIVMSLLLERCVALGARIARPGEFSERAFLNDKIDLAQAEAIADLIDSSTQRAARGAVRSLQGEFSGQVHALVENVTALRMYVEAAIDFPEEEIDFLADDTLKERLQLCQQDMEVLSKNAGLGSLLRDGISLVLVGKPNAGKSSLMNVLTGRDTSIVTDVPGTTRDPIHDTIHLNGIPVRLTDTAGLRQTDDIVESEGVRRTEQVLEAADHALLVVDCAESEQAMDEIVGELSAPLSPDQERTVVLNKIDLVPASGQRLKRKDCILVSAKTGEGVDHLREHLLKQLGAESDAEGTITARARHVDALNKAQLSLIEAGRRLLHGDGELMAEDLRIAQQHLGEITGEVTADDLLGRIFSTFCIGK